MSNPLMVKGNKLGRGKKGCSGRKTKLEEIKIVIEEAKERITNEALSALANKIVFQSMQEKGILTAKDLALPITLKGFTEKKEVVLKGLSELFDNSQEDDNK